MPVVGLSGPNAIGKTTALRRWCARYPSLWAALADNQRETDGARWDEVLASPPNVNGWKGDLACKERLVSSHRLSPRVTVVDSARTTALNFFLPGEAIVLVTCGWKAMEDNLRARCAASGKAFRGDYWDRKKLVYESSRRYLGFLSRSSANVRVFEVEDRERDWPAVDEYFGRVFRKLHNQLVRAHE